MAYSIDNTKSKISEIKKNIETKKGELDDLEKDKQELLDAGLDIQNNEDLDDKTKRVVRESISQSLETLSEKGEELSSDMTEDYQALNKESQEVHKSMESNMSEQKKLENKKNILEKFGLGKGVENSINELQENQRDLEDTIQDINETTQELDKVSGKLQSL